MSAILSMISFYPWLTIIGKIETIYNTIPTCVNVFKFFHFSLDVFNPGLFIIDRQNPEDDLINEPHKISLCWNQPQLLINLVDKAKNLSNLNLIGYEELTDLALVIKSTFSKYCFINVRIFAGVHCWSN